MTQPIQRFSNPAFSAVLDPSTFPASYNFPVQSANLKIVSINIQAFPPLISYFTDQSMSASSKAAYLKTFLATQGLLDADVIVFQEAFDDPARETMQATLQTLGFKHITGVPERHGLWRNFTQDGGVFIASKHLFEGTPHLEVFSDATGRDARADKGFVHVRITKEGHIYHVIGTHMQADDDTATISEPGIRRVQLAQIRAYIDEIRQKYVGEPIILAGDLNVARGSGEYEKLFNYGMGQLLYGALAGAYTSDSAHDTSPSGGTVLDHILWFPNFSYPGLTPDSGYIPGGQSFFLNKFDLTAKGINTIPNPPATNGNDPLLAVANKMFTDFTDHRPLVANFNFLFTANRGILRLSNSESFTQTPGSDPKYIFTYTDPSAPANAKNIINFTNGNNIVNAGDGDDIVEGGSGHEKFYGGPGHDTLKGGPGRDLLNGGRDPDLLEGGRGDDLLLDDWYDRVDGDRFYGGPGEDNIVMLFGSNYAEGDSLEYDNPKEPWSYSGVNEPDIFWINGLPDALAGGGIATIKDFGLDIDKLKIVAYGDLSYFGTRAVMRQVPIPVEDGELPHTYHAQDVYIYARNHGGTQRDIAILRDVDHGRFIQNLSQNMEVVNYFPREYSNSLHDDFGVAT